ncbi:hypothetical protein OG302_20675 [Streptomyces sp. NBC_01283]|uniref:hypothetical protein n=1 Tax=Streptomyces sp. NBC_01283 TaxID=2903812 RepID=UPI00352BD6A7|nr:hypothetical protein OG302_20675 [Streptomyces sp. NBC_01283]
MRATRRTFRTAAIATGAIAALAVPTTAAFAADAPSNPQGQVAAGDRPGASDQDGNGQDQTDQDHTDKDQTDNGQKDKDQADKDQTDQDKTDQDKSKDPETPKPGSWESKGTTDLGKGWSAKVDVNASARSAKAAVTLNGKAKGSLEAYINPKTTKIDGNTFKLSADGTITRTGAKPVPPKPQPKPKPDHKRHLVHQYTNLGGTGFDAKVYKTKAGYEADMIAKSTDTGKKVVWDTIKQSGHKPAYGQHNGAHFVLNPDGTMKGWTEGKTHGNGNTGHGQKPQVQVQPKNGASHVVPKGGVKAGADGMSPAGDSAPLMAAGGGMAALGAAGLGFALYRRKQNN